ncbi:MAG: hypothetical protein AAGC60_21795 [Acidobacteriota bacterium]
MADKLTVHGYLSQAYADSSDGQVLGVPTDGTTDYRTMALQFRYAVTDKDSVVVQLSHETQGESPFDDLRDEIELDWAFYEHAFDAGTTLRVGRIPIAFGIYNELRDVGTLLEFYRPPTSIYFEGAFSNEAVDGLSLSHRFDWSWPLTVDVYYGGWQRYDSSAPITDVGVGEVDDAIGGQLWLETPVDGLRFGLAAQTWDLSGGLTRLRSGEEDPADVILASFELSRERWYIRGEWQEIATSILVAPNLDYTAWYAQAGVRFGSWGVNLLFENSDIEGTGGFAPVGIDPFYEDTVLGVTYSFSPSVVAKAEYHDIETGLFELDALAPELPEDRATELFIASLSVSF